MRSSKANVRGNAVVKIHSRDHPTALTASIPIFQPPVACGRSSSSVETLGVGGEGWKDASLIRGAGCPWGVKYVIHLDVVYSHFWTIIR